MPETGAYLYPSAPSDHHDQEPPSSSAWTRNVTGKALLSISENHGNASNLQDFLMFYTRWCMMIILQDRIMLIQLGSRGMIVNC